MTVTGNNLVTTAEGGTALVPMFIDVDDLGKGNSLVYGQIHPTKGPAIPIGH